MTELKITKIKLKVGGNICSRLNLTVHLTYFGGPHLFQIYYRYNKYPKFEKLFWRMNFSLKGLQRLKI